MKRSPSDMMHIGNLLENSVGKYRSGNDGDMIRVWSVWASALGGEIAANSRPSAFKGRMLIVNVSNSAWLHHFTFMKKTMIEKINQALDKDLVRDLTFKIGTVSPPDRSAAKE